MDQSAGAAPLRSPTSPAATSQPRQKCAATCAAWCMRPRAGVPPASCTTPHGCCCAIRRGSQRCCRISPCGTPPHPPTARCRRRRPKCGATPSRRGDRRRSPRPPRRLASPRRGTSRACPSPRWVRPAPRRTATARRRARREPVTTTIRTLARPSTAHGIRIVAEETSCRGGAS
jgi:hypothetical protein